MSGLRSGKYEPRWTYASGFRTQHAALDAVEEFYACGLIDETDDPDSHDVELLMAGEDGGGDQHRLARYRYAEIFQRDQREDQPVSVVAEGAR